MARVALPEVENHPYPEFQQALIAYGANDIERSAVLKISRPTILGWRMGRVIPKVETLARHPSLLAAYLNDLASTTRQAA